MGESFYFGIVEVHFFIKCISLLCKADKKSHIDDGPY